MASLREAEEYTAKSGKKFKYDARDLLDIDTALAKCDAIVTAAEEGCESLCKNISNVQIGKETLCVADSSLEPALEEVGNYIKSIASEGVKPTTDEIKERATTAFNKKQDDENDRAKKDCEAENARWEAEQAEKAKQNEESS